MFRRLPIRLLCVSLIAVVSCALLLAAGRSRTERVTLPRATANILQQISGDGHVIGFDRAGIYLARGSHELHVEFVNSNCPKPISADAGKAPRATHSPTRVIYSNLWNGISLVYDAPDQGIVRSTYRVEPNAKPEDIRLRYHAPVTCQDNGTLRVPFRTGAFFESAPKAWQEDDGKRVDVPVKFVAQANREISFALGNYDRSKALVIDPTLTWNTFLGSNDEDEGTGIAVDLSGNVYVSGFSHASWGAPVRPYGGGFDAFVAKLDANGNLIWNTFLGGPNDETGQGVAADATGNVYVVGISTETWGIPVSPYSGANDVFAAKLDTNGNLVWNTFLGSADDDHGQAIAVDPLGNIDVAGFSRGSWGAPVNPPAGDYDAFVARLSQTGSLVWNTFLGGPSTDQGNSVAGDAFGNVYIVGSSHLPWGTPVRPFSGDEDAFAAKLDNSGNLVWNTFLGGVNAGGNSVAVDQTGSVYVGGSGDSSWGTPVAPFNGDGDAFVAKLDQNGAVVWNTFVGGNAQDVGNAIASDAAGSNIYLIGFSTGPWGTPTRPFVGGMDAFAAQLDANGDLVSNAFLGSGDDTGNAVALDAVGNVYIAGTSAGSWGAPVRAFSSPNDAFVAKLGPGSATPTPTPTATPTPTPTATPTATPTPTPTATPTPTPTATPSPTPTPGCQLSTSIMANFNGTPISAGAYVWFNSVLMPGGLSSSAPVTFRFTQQRVTGPDFTLVVPDAQVTFDPSATTATTTFSGGMWITRVPSSGLAGNTFFSGVGFQVPVNISGGTKNITWTGVVVPDTAGTRLQWQWGGAVYRTFSANYNALGVKPVDDNKASVYKNSDHAGTPENFLTQVIGGATGGGGANYTGSYSGTANVGPCP